MYRNNGNFRGNCITQKELQLSNSLRKLWVEHVMWTRSFIISTASDLKDLDAVTKRLLRNPTDLAKLFMPFYGSQTAKKIEQLFTEHLSIAGQLVNAAKEGKPDAVTELRNKWYANADEIASFLNEINPFWDKKTWQTMLYDHLRMTENEAVQILTQQYEASINEYDSIQEQALNMADFMTRGIINQFNL